jgi:hypothetical protein
VSGATTPPQLAGAVQIANILALVFFCLFILTSIAPARHERWLWALALWAVNPIAIILERKIWLPSMLPLPAVLFYVTWWWRRIPTAAFVWGVMGAVLPQIHLGAALLTAAVFAWTLVHDRAAIPWKSWLAGTVVGTLPALPWLIEMAHSVGDLPARWRGPNPTYYLRWVTQPFGLGLEYSLGPADFAAFLRMPQIAGVSTWLIGALHLVLVALMILVLARAGMRFRAVGQRSWPHVLRAVFLGGRSAGSMQTDIIWWS